MLAKGHKGLQWHSDDISVQQQSPRALKMVPSIKQSPGLSSQSLRNTTGRPPQSQRDCWKPVDLVPGFWTWPPHSRCPESIFAGSSAPQNFCLPSPPTKPRSPVGQTGVGRPAGRGGSRAGERAVGGGVGRVGVARSDPKGRRLRFAGLRGDLLQSGQS